ncbi:MAG: sensor domain-containing diguanylate cyclase, partial [Mariprofundaceae bacterium]|nr:sensor domain-containing diguanylate cyclase [Mariprofundaceae bacterium]
QRVLDSMLNMALSRMDMQELLNHVLEVVLTIPSFTLLDKGAIFLADEEDETLTMAAQRNLSDDLLRTCSRIPFGKYLCGKAAESRDIVYADHVDHQYEIIYDGIQPHGHYCLPILAENQLLGVLNIYLPENHTGSEPEHIYLKTVADTLACIIDRKQGEGRMQHLAHNDLLTGLPNRTLFLQQLEISLELAKRHEDKFALMFIDLDCFKKVNDTLGHDIGDLLLREVAIRLQLCVRKTDTIARLGGDEFTVIMSRITQAGQPARVADKIIRSLGSVFTLAGKDVRIGCSIGIALYPNDSEDTSTLLKQADSAMYRAKKHRNLFSFYNLKISEPQG